MERTIKLKLELSKENKETLRQTMVLSNQVFNEIARYGFENHTCSKVSVHRATYYSIREKHLNFHVLFFKGSEMLRATVRF